MLRPVRGMNHDAGGSPRTRGTVMYLINIKLYVLQTAGYITRTVLPHAPDRKEVRCAFVF